MAGLALAANIGAIISLADIAFWSGKEVVDGLLKLKEVDDNVKGVKDVIDEIQLLESLIASVHVVAVNLQTSPCLLRDQGALPIFEVLLKDCEKEFRILHDAVRDACPPPDQWFRLLRSRITWVLGDAKVVRARRKLERYRKQFHFELSIMGR